MAEERGAFTISDLMAHNGNKSRAWILQCIAAGRLPEPDERIGKNQKFMIWHNLHKIAAAKK